MAEIRTLIGDCLSVLDSFPEGRFDLIYLDPPFFTQKEQVLTTRDGKATYSFSDIWKSHNEYACFFLCSPPEITPRSRINRFSFFSL
jgi:DNA modification methylase